MKILVSILSLSLTLHLISALPRRSSSFRNSRLDSYAPPEDNSGEPSGPYPPSGWAPNGDLLLVPGESHSSRQNAVDTTYAPPPSNNYGPAAATTTTTTPPPATPAQPDFDESGEVESSNRPAGEAGQYYVLLPDGKLQKVKYSGKKKGRGQYEAQVEYELVDPVRSPLYAYQGLPLTYTQ